VSVSRTSLPIIGTASADHTAIVWGMHSGRPLLHYKGHSGSVNSVRFHPAKELVLTSSGDGTAHIWQCAVHLYNESLFGRLASSEDELADNQGTQVRVLLPSSRYNCNYKLQFFVSRSQSYASSGVHSTLESF
jgi:WD40 repeat protein